MNGDHWALEKTKTINSQRYIILKKGMQNQGQKEFPLSSMLTQLRQCFNFQRSARLWFGPLLQVPDPLQSPQITFDISKDEYIEMLRVLNYVTADILTFYSKSPPEDVFRLLYLIKAIFGLNNDTLDPKLSGYQQQVSSIFMCNNLALFFLKHGQYTYAHDCFDLILQVVTEDKVDIGMDILLSALSNQLTLVKAHQHPEMRQKTALIVKHLQRAYHKLISKYLSQGCTESTLMMILAVFRQHRENFGQQTKDQNLMLLRKFQQTLNVNRSVELVRHNKTLQPNKDVADMLINKNMQFQKSNIILKKAELYFFTSSLLFSRKLENRKKQQAVTQDRSYAEILKNQPFSDLTHQHQKTQTIEEIDDLTTKLDDDKKSDSFFDKANLTPVQSRIERRDISTPKLKITKIPTSSETTSNKYQKSQMESAFNLFHQVQEPKRVKRIDLEQGIVLKIGEFILEIIRDGIIISDFLKTTRRYLTWQKLLLLIQNFHLTQLFTQFLPIHCFYDVSRILMPYMCDSSSDQPMICEKPEELIELDVQTKLYHVEEKYLKIFRMNRFNSDHIDFSIDCYLDEFQNYFDELNKNEYLHHLNCRILDLPFKAYEHYMVKRYRKSKKITVEQVISQIGVDRFEEMESVGESSFKILMAMRKNTQLFVYFKEKDLEQTQNAEYLPLVVVDMFEKEKKLSLKFPLYKCNRFFPLAKNEMGAWMKRYGKIVIEGYHRCFQDFPYSFYNLQYFDVRTYAKKVELMPTGKYLTPVTAEIIGSGTRIWGICIRYFEQSFVNENVTFIYNPYFDLLRPVIDMKPEARKKVLVDHLLEGKISTSYRKLIEFKLIGTMINIFNYWSIIDF